MACSKLSSHNDDFSIFTGLFEQANITVGDTLDFSTLTYGTHASSPHSTTEVPDSLFQLLIDQKYLSDVRYNSSLTHFALGTIQLSDDLTGYVVGQYDNANLYVSQMFVYSKSAGTFQDAQSLNYHIVAGSFEGDRNAWYTDVNGDGTKDIIYHELGRNQDTGEINSNFYIETWGESSFVIINLENADAIQAAFPLNLLEQKSIDLPETTEEIETETVEDSEPSGDDLDEFGF